MRDIDLLVISLSSPLLFGIYQDDKLIESIKSEEKTTEILPSLFKDISEKYNVKSLYYANGPGSFMAIKVTYIFFKTMSIVKKIPFFAQEAFYFNENSPIKALGKLYFVKNSNTISMEKIDISTLKEFSLPNTLNKEDFSSDTLPAYHIGAV